MNTTPVKLLPTEPYKQLLAHTIEKIKVLNNQTTIKRNQEKFEFPNKIEKDIKMIIIFKTSVLNPLIDWPFNFENEKLKTVLAIDLILWYRNNRPDLLDVLKNLI